MKQRRKGRTESAQDGPKQQEYSQQKELPQQAIIQQKTETILWRWIGLLSPTGKIAAAIGLFLAFVGTYYAFSPKISISPSELIEATNPYTTPFTIKNESLLPLRYIKTVWKFREIISENGKPINFNGPYVRTVSPDIPYLGAGEPTTVFLPKLYEPIKKAKNLSYLDIEVVVLYRPYLLPFNRSKELRFVTVKTGNNTFRWITKAVSE